MGRFWKYVLFAALGAAMPLSSVAQEPWDASDVNDSNLDMHPSEKIMNDGRVLEGMTAWSQRSNNNRAIMIQSEGGVRESTGEVTFNYYGHMAVMITSPRGVKIMIDPWRNDPSQVWGVWYKQFFPFVRVDVGLSTHAHFDHDNLAGLDSIMLLDRMGGNWEFGDVKITGIVEKHVCRRMGKLKWDTIVAEVEGYDPCPPTNPTQWDNNMYVVETGGMRIFHSGDNRPDKPDNVWDLIGKLDVVIQAVDDSGHILDHRTVDELCEKTGAHVIIPGHYYIEGITVKESTLESADHFVTGHTGNYTILDKPELTLSPEKIKDLKCHVMSFANTTMIPIWTPPPGSDQYPAEFRKNFYGADYTGLH